LNLYELTTKNINDRKKKFSIHQKERALQKNPSLSIDPSKSALQKKIRSLDQFVKKRIAHAKKKISHSRPIHQKAHCKKVILHLDFKKRIARKSLKAQ
jgi:hypothetical protein